MSDSIWILRDPSGKVIGASAHDAFMTLDETNTDQLPIELHNEFVRSLRNDRTQPITVQGYTLTREPLTPRVSGDGVTVVDEAMAATGRHLYDDVLRCIPADWKPDYARDWGKLGAILAEFIDDLREGRYPAAAEKVAITDAMREAAYEATCLAATGHPWSAYKETSQGRILREHVDIALTAALSPEVTP